MSATFQPAWWCRGAHAQTLWPYLFRAAPRLSLRRERLELPDGDFLDLDWSPRRTGPIVLILHGLEGSSESKYARGLLKAVHEFGWRGVVMHFRGCSGELNRLSRRYHSGETGDLAYVVRQLHAREPATPIAVVGYSLGGNALLKWLGETGITAPVCAAAAVSVPFRLDDSANRMNKGFSRLYQWSLVRKLRQATAAKQSVMSLPLESLDLSRLRSFWQFDDQVTAPLHGFEGADHYYRVSSSRQYLRGIRLPTLIIHALDDPFMEPETVPAREEISPDVRLEASPHGGHVGFVAGRWPWSPHYWLESRIPSFLQTYLVPPWK